MKGEHEINTLQGQKKSMAFLEDVFHFCMQLGISAYKRIQKAQNTERHTSLLLLFVNVLESYKFPLVFLWWCYLKTLKNFKMVSLAPTSI